MTEHADASLATARWFIDMLARHDVEEVVLAPGSRSAALALAVHAADAAGRFRLHVRVDEREAAFLALGLAKASGRVVPVITTSGTAVANLHPAMLEAHHARVGLVAVTADRPARLWGTGANQTTRQRGLFGHLDELDETEARERVERTGHVFSTRAPLHLNLEFDQPLVTPHEWDFADLPSPVAESDRDPVVEPSPVEPSPVEPSPVEPSPVEHRRIDVSARTVVIAGDGAGPTAGQIADRHGLALLAEPTSGSRSGGALPAYRLVLDEFADEVERIISFGHATLSRPVTEWLARRDIEIVHVGDQSTYPVRAAENVVWASGIEVEGRGDPDWLAAWRAASDRAVAGLPPHPAHDLARAVWSASAGGLLWVGSSNSIRHLDLVATGVGGDQRIVWANRGLSGIDGTISSSIGATLAARAAGHTGPAIALMGDLTFLHGANGLLIGPDEPMPDLTIVVANDDGGAIFAGLEQGGPEYAAAFERVFGTPTRTDLAALCRAHDVRHERVESDRLASALAQPARGLRVIEVPLPR